MSDNMYDLLVLGSGPGGYVAAIRASQLGMKTAIIEKNKPGGVCLNLGCIPTKSLISHADMALCLSKMKRFGLNDTVSILDYSLIQKRSGIAAEKLSKSIVYLLKKHQVKLIEATGKLGRPGEIICDDNTVLKGRKIIIATGSRPALIPGFEINEKDILSSNGALLMNDLPEKMLIIGSGAIGLEFAHIFNAFGVEIQIAEIEDQIYPGEDKELAEVLHNSFRKRGIVIHTGTKATSLIRHSHDNLSVNLEHNDNSNSTIDVNRVLVATGRTPNSNDLGLEGSDIITDKGYIKTGDYYQTDITGLYAIGDVIGAPLLAHAASKEAEIAVEHIAGLPAVKQINKSQVPFMVYTRPEIASFGTTALECEKNGIDFEEFSMPFKGIGRAVAAEEPEGLIKIRIEKGSRRILWAGAAGAEVSGIIHELLLAKNAEISPETIADMIHAHPTFSEGAMEIMRLVSGKAIHI